MSTIQYVWMYVKHYLAISLRTGYDLAMGYDYISLINAIAHPGSIALLIGYWRGKAIEWTAIPAGAACVLGCEEC